MKLEEINDLHRDGYERFIYDDWIKDIPGGSLIKTEIGHTSQGYAIWKIRKVKLPF